MVQQSYCTDRAHFSHSTSTHPQEVPERCFVTGYKLLWSTDLSVLPATNQTKKQRFVECLCYTMTLSQIRNRTSICNQGHERVYGMLEEALNGMETVTQLVRVFRTCCSLPLLQPQCRTDTKVRQQTAFRPLHCSLGCLLSVVNLLHSDQYAGFVHLYHIRDMFS